jgi:osmotically-inducible protein OsmY
MTDEQTQLTDDHVQHHVEDALEWADPAVNASGIGVTVDGGVVTLRGAVATGSEKVTAERVALLVCGVKGVINDLAVRVVPGVAVRDEWLTLQS